MNILLADIGGSDIKYLQTEENTIERVAVQKKTPEGILLQIKDISEGCDGIALALPGTVKPSGKWSDSAAYKTMGKSFDVRSFLESISAPPLQALSQDVFAAGRGLGLIYPEIDRLSVLNLGSGLGGSVVVSGWPWVGLGQEVGHLQIMNRKRECFCGQINCLEASAGWLAIRERNPSFKSPGEIAKAASEGIKDALEIIEEAEEAVAKAAAVMATTIAGQVIFLIGGTGEALFADKTRMSSLSDKVNEFCLPSIAQSSPLLPGPGPEAAILGLASLAGVKLDNLTKRKAE